VNPFGYFPILDQPIVDLVCWEIGFIGLFLLNELDSRISIFSLVPLLVEALVKSEFLLISRDDLIQLLVGVDFLVVFFLLNLIFCSAKQVSQHLVPIDVFTLLVLIELPSLNNNVVKLSLRGRSCEKSRLDSRVCDQSVHTDLVLRADSMSSVHRL